MFRHLVVAFVLCCSAAFAAGILDQPHVAVYGTAEIKVAPNEMDWRLTVRNEDKELPATAQRHAEIVNKVVKLLNSMNIEKDSLQTSRMQFGENWEYLTNRRTRSGFFASTDISFKITDLNLYEKLWFGLAQIKEVSIQNVEYGHSDRIRLQNESRQKALLAAREKAAALARTLGSQIGEALKIEESAPQFGPVPFARMTANVALAEGAGTPAQILAPGQITISTQVHAVFRLVN